MTTARKLWLGFGLLIALLALLGASTVVRVRAVESDADARASVAITLTLTAVCVLIAAATGVLVGRDVVRAERLSRDGEEKYRTLVEASPQMVWALRPDWTMMFVSRTWTEFTGKTAEQARTVQDRDELFHPDDLPGFLASIAGPWERGEAHEVVARQRRRDGQYRWTSSRAVPVKDEAGAVVLWIGTTTDIHEQRLAEDALQRSQAEYRLLVESNPALICRFLADGTLTFVNDTYCQTFGKTREALLGSRFLSLVPPEDHPAVRRMLAALSPEMEPYTHEYRVVLADGSVRWQQWTARAARGAGAETEYQAVGVDVTDRKRAEEAASESEHRLRAILDSEPECVKLLAADGTLLEMNPAGLAMIEATEAEVLGQNVCALVVPEHREAFMDLTRRVFAGQPSRLEFRMVGLKGAARWLETHATPLRDREGRIVAALGVTRDVTAAKELQEGILASRRIFEAVLDNIPQGVFWKDRNSRYLGCNSVVRRAFGIARPEDIVGKTDFDVPGLTREQAAYFVQKDREVMESGEPILGIVEPATLADGSTIWMETNKIPMRDSAGQVVGILGTWQDITERKRIEEALSASEARKRAIVEAAFDAIVTIGSDGRVIEWNPRAERIFGVRAADAVGVPIETLIIPPRLRDAHRAGLRRYHQTGEAPVLNQLLELTAVHADGGEFPVEVFISPLHGSGATEFTAFIRDLTERKRLEQQLLQSQKMDAVGQLAGGVAHDFNNLLTVINGYSDMLLARAAPEEAGRHELEQVRNAGERAAGLTRQLLAFSRQTVLEAKVLDVNTIVWESEKMLRRVIGEDIELAVRPAPALARVKADPGQIGQLLLNLALNARDAMPTGGQLTIETEGVELDEVFAARRPDVKPGHYVLLSVTDTGCGMTADVRSRIFEPFFTTKGPGKGTGLGLAVVHGIVKQSGGHVDVESEPGRGTTFEVYLPATEAAPGVRSRLFPRKPAKRGTETVLLVEDEDAVRRVGETALRSLGYTVFAASGGAEALRVMEEHGNGIALLVTDVVMPGMSGPQLADSLRDRYPRLKVLFMSGYTSDAVLRHGILDGEANFLPKPFTPISLANKVREVLDNE